MKRRKWTKSGKGVACFCFQRESWFKVVGLSLLPSVNVCSILPGVRRGFQAPGPHRKA